MNETEYRELEKQSNEQTTQKLYKLWCRNFVGNLEFMEAQGRFKGLDLFMPGLPCLCVGTGPSLDDNIKILKKIKGRIPIIAADRAFMRLRDSGVDPDFIIAVDPQKEILKMFQKDGKTVSLKNEFIVLEARCNTLLVNEVIKAGAKIFWYNTSMPETTPTQKGDPFYTFAYQIFGDSQRLGAMVSCATVGNQAAFMAYKMDCNPIAVLGMDMCWRSWRDVPPSHAITDAEDRDGNIVPTYGGFIVAAHGMEYNAMHLAKPGTQIQRNEINWINCGGGLLKKHIFEPMALEDFIDKYADALPQHLRLLSERKAAYKKKWEESLEPERLRGLCGLNYIVERNKMAKEEEEAQKKAAAKPNLIIPATTAAIDKAVADVLGKTAEVQNLTVLDGGKK